MLGTAFKDDKRHNLLPADPHQDDGHPHLDRSPQRAAALQCRRDGLVLPTNKRAPCPHPQVVGEEEGMGK